MPRDDVVHTLPMRWADLDSLNHVNNVVYLDYAAEARSLLVEDRVIGPDERPSRIAIDFLRPLLLSSTPVRVTSRRDGDEIVQAIRPADADTDHARVVTILGGRSDLVAQPGAGTAAQVSLRHSDLDAAGCVTTTKMFELFQESRIHFVRTRLSSMSPGRFVVGHVAVDFARPLAWRREPYTSVNWISRIGDSSITIRSQVHDGDDVVAECRSVLVGFDLDQQRSRRLGADEKAELSLLCSP